MTFLPLDPENIIFSDNYIKPNQTECDIALIGIPEEYNEKLQKYLELHKQRNTQFNKKKVLYFEDSNLDADFYD